MAFYRIGNVGLALTAAARQVLDLSGGVAPGTPVGGQTVDTYSYLNSLHNHDAGDGDANTSTGNWVARMAAQAPGGGNTYTGGRQFGFPDAWDAPPSDGQGQEDVASPYVVGEGSWTGCSQVEMLEFVPDNFEGPNYSPDSPNGMGFTYTTLLLGLIDAWETNAANANRRYVVYAGWPDMGAFGDPTTLDPTEIANYQIMGLGAYQTWLETLVSMLRAERPSLDIRLHDVSRVLLMTWRDTVVSTVAAGVLFEDDAPHGRATWYFLAGVAEYIEIFNEKPPVGFTFDPGWDVDSIVTTNYQDIVDYIWGVLRP